MRLASQHCKKFLRCILPNIPKSGGATLSGSAGGSFLAPTTTIDPVLWVESLFLSLENYVKVNSSIAYNILFSFPSAEDLGNLMAFPRTIIHFDIDDHNSPPIGFGDQVVDHVFDNPEGTVRDVELNQHVINFDVGVWASAKSGGVSSRLKTLQLLTNLFNGPSAFMRVREHLGIEIVSFAGGSFVTDDIDNVPVWRIIGMTLVVRAFTRKVIGPDTFITSIRQEPGIFFHDEVLVPITG